MWIIFGARNSAICGAELPVLNSKKELQRRYRKNPLFLPVSTHMQSAITQNLQQSCQQKRRQFAVLIDPDEVDAYRLQQLVQTAVDSGVDYFFVGGSLVVGSDMEDTIRFLKTHTTIPVVIFPGSIQQVHPSADALLFLSLISGRNPELLIGNQVLAAPYIRKSGLEAIPTGYILVDGGAPTTVSYISNTNPIPHDKKEIAVSTALAGEMLGMKVIYMDAGSGARRHISADMIKAVSTVITVPLIVGGGIRTPESAYELSSAGADVIVVGNAIEKDPSLIREISFAIHSATVNG
jgi:putative glycerol-1-phosphate prenyltransferase